MKSRPPQPGRPRRALRRIAPVLLAALLGAGAWLLLRSREAAGPPNGVWKPSDPPAPGAVPWPSSVSSQRLEALLAQAAEAYARGDLPAGDARASEVIDPLLRQGKAPAELGPYHLQRVESALGRGDQAAAESLALAWLERFPRDLDHNFLLGQIRYQARRWSQAAECFRKVTEVSPGLLDGYRWLAQTCQQLGAQPEALAASARTLELIGFPGGAYSAHPQCDQVLRNAMVVYHRFQVYDRLAEVAHAYRTRLEASGSQEKDLAEPLMAEGIALSNLGRGEEAEPLLRKALADPGNAPNADELGFELGLCIARRGDWKGAARAFAELLARSPHYAKAYHQLALALDRLGRGETAAAFHAKFEELAPSERELRRERELRGAGFPARAAISAARARALRGEIARAEQALRAPELKADPFAVIALADFYLECLRLEEVSRVLQHAATLIGKDHRDLVGRQGQVLVLRGNEGEGRALVEQAAAQENGESYWHLRLAELHLQLGRPAEAVKVLEPLPRGAGEGETAFLLGRALVEAGQASRGAEILGAIPSSDLRYAEWGAGAWLAVAILEADRPGKEKDAGLLLQALSRTARRSLPCLKAQMLLAADAAQRAARAAELREREALEKDVITLTGLVAQAPWNESADLRLKLGRHLARAGRLADAVRQASLAAAASPSSPEGPLLQAELHAGTAEVFLRLAALREAVRRGADSPARREELARIEAEWLR